MKGAFVGRFIGRVSTQRYFIAQTFANRSRCNIRHEKTLRHRSPDLQAPTTVTRNPIMQDGPQGAFYLFLSLPILFLSILHAKPFSNLRYCWILRCTTVYSVLPSASRSRTHGPPCIHFYHYLCNTGRGAESTHRTPRKQLLMRLVGVLNSSLAPCTSLSLVSQLTFWLKANFLLLLRSTVLSSPAMGRTIIELDLHPGNLRRSSSYSTKL